jgi:hypothetical protein
VGDFIASLAAELEGEFIKLTDDGWIGVDTIGEADGVWLLCPRCWVDNGYSAIGTHRVVCWSPRVPQTVTPRPGRWALVGTSIHDLTLVAGSSSIAIQGGCNAHFYIRRGSIVFA